MIVTPVAPPPARLGPVALLRGAFGLASLVAILSVVAAIPVLQLLTLGFLLDAEGRFARTGRLRDAMPWLPVFGRVGGAVAGVLVSFLPWYVLADFRHAAHLIDPTSPAARNLRVWTLAAAVAGALHAALALHRGGRPSYFVRPFGNLVHLIGRLRDPARYPSPYPEIRAELATLEPGRTFLLGLKGFVAALAWIAVPTALLAVGQRAPGVALLGGLALAVAVIPLPLLQAHVAATGRLRAGFELREAWARHRGAPLVALLSLVLTLGLALPLYLLKLEVIPRDVRVLAAGIFIVTILPTKLVTAKAYARGGTRTAHGVFRFASALAALPVAGFYVLILFFTRYVDWDGVAGMFQQHAFLVPVAFY